MIFLRELLSWDFQKKYQLIFNSKKFYFQMYKRLDLHDFQIKLSG